jgi:hypothetical protein
MIELAVAACGNPAHFAEERTPAGVLRFLRVRRYLVCFAKVSRHISMVLSHGHTSLSARRVEIRTRLGSLGI